MTRSPTETAIITGPSGGIGRVIALELARDGFAVAVNYAGSTVEAAALGRGLRTGWRIALR